MDNDKILWTKCCCDDLGNPVLKKLVTRNDKIQYKFQCSVCGKNRSQPIPHSSLTDEEKESAELYDHEIQVNYFKKRAEERKTEFEKEQEARIAKYHEYLDSEVWKALRRCRLNIDSHICKMCGAVATIVHHLSYENIYNETMDDLVSVCSDCHNKIHSENIMTTIKWPLSMLKDIYK